MSKTIEEIKNEYAKELGYSSWINIGYNADSEKRNNEVAKRYAKAQSEKLEKQLDILFKLLSHIQNREVHVNDSIDKLINNALDEISKT